MEEMAREAVGETECVVYMGPGHQQRVGCSINHYVINANPSLIESVLLCNYVMASFGTSGGVLLSSSTCVTLPVLSLS